MEPLDVDLVAFRQGGWDDGPVIAHEHVVNVLTTDRSFTELDHAQVPDVSEPDAFEDRLDR